MNYNNTSDNVISNLYKFDIFILDLLISTTVSCVVSPHREKILLPFPPMFDDFKDLEQLISKLKKKDIFEILKKENNDIDIKNKFDLIDTKLYSFINFIIKSNKLQLKSESIISEIFFNNNKSLKDDVRIFEINNKRSISYKFDIKNPKYLYHGSSFYNWYSIMRNGLKNYSNTSMMANGSVHGNGVYFSDSISFANGYCHVKNKLNIDIENNWNEDNLMIIGMQKTYKIVSFYMFYSFFTLFYIFAYFFFVFS